jgi:hypothetical protein
MSIFKIFPLLTLLVFSVPGHTDQILRQFDGERSVDVVGQNVAPPLKAVTYNWPTVTNEVVQSGNKAYRFWLTNDGSLYNGIEAAKYRTEFEGLIQNSGDVQIKFDEVYIIRMDFYQDANNWAPDSAGESWPGQMHEVPKDLTAECAADSSLCNDWANWGVGTCQQSALSTAPFFNQWNNGIMSFRRWGGVELWNATPAKGQWHKLVLRVKISRTGNGFIQSWFDGVQKPSYTGQTHRNDTALNVYCGKSTTTTGDVGFQNPKWAVGLYKYTWRNHAKTDTDHRLGYVDNVIWVHDTTLNGSAFALVGGTGPLTPVDNTPPVITGPSVSSITYSSGVVSWTTDEAAKGSITVNGTTLTDNSLTTTKSFSIGSLTPSTVYPFSITSTDAANNVSNSSGTFTTLADTVAPVITSPAVSNITASGATFTWQTDEDSSSRVKVYTTTYSGTPVYVATLVKDHSITISDAPAGTLLTYNLRSVDAYGNTSNEYGTFTTLQAIVPLTNPTLSLDTDDFNGSSLGSNWTWYDPLANSTLAISNGHLGITVPTGGSSHNLVVGNTNAPRVIQSIANTDFDVFAKFDTLPMVINEATGITFEKSPTEMVIVDLVSNGTNVAIEEWFLTPTAKTLRNKLYLNTTPPKGIRVKRVGDIWSIYYSHGDEVWTKIDTVTYVTQVYNIGLMNSNWGSPAPVFTTSIDKFGYYGTKIVSDVTTQDVTHCAYSLDGAADVDTLVEAVATGKRCSISIVPFSAGSHTIKSKFVNIDPVAGRNESPYSSPDLTFLKPTN